MRKKKVLLIAGGGTLGSYTSYELLKAGCAVDVIALEDLKSLNKNLRYFKAYVDDALLKRLFEENRYDAIVDFIHYADPEAYKPRARLLLANTDQLVFLSSYRVYDDAAHPISEDSPMLPDVSKDEYLLAHENYGIPKAKSERFLRSLGVKNFTILRPLISFSHFRLDLVTQGAAPLLFRSAAGKKILLPAASKDVVAGVGWAGNIGKMIARLLFNERALGEAFTLGTGEVNTWGQVADFYKDLLGSSFEWVDTVDYLENATPNTYMDRCMIYHDRLLDRTIDNRKLLAATGLAMRDFTHCYDGIVTELEILASRPDLVARFDTPTFRAISEKTDAYLASHKG
ncbi:MAG: hypothetical protein ACOYI8_01285 [Christensenellales bacterium]